MMKDIAHILQSHQLKWTSTRERILALLISMQRPLSAPELYRCFGQQEDRVTIYRVLDALYKRGILVKVLDEKGGARFFYSKDAAIDKPHFQCRDCGCLYGLPELPESYLDQLTAFDIEQAVLVFRGVCSACKGKQPDHGRNKQELS